MAVNERERNEIVYDVKRHIGVVAIYPTGWQKELNLIAWNNSAPKYDIRDWDAEHKHMSRGITLHKEEMKALGEMLRSEKF